MPERRRQFTPEFKDEAVKMVIETSRPIAEVARDIHLNDPVCWRRKAYAEAMRLEGGAPNLSLV